MTKYYKLGKNAESYSDPLSGVNLAKGQVAKFDLSEATYADADKNLRRATADGHLVLAEEAEFDEYEAKTEKAVAQADLHEAKRIFDRKSVLGGALDENQKAKLAEDAKSLSKLQAPKANEADGAEDDEDEEEDDLTKSELIDAIKASTLSDEEKKGLSKKTHEELTEIYNKIPK